MGRLHGHDSRHASLSTPDHEFCRRLHARLACIRVANVGKCLEAGDCECSAALTTSARNDDRGTNEVSDMKSWVFRVVL
jgi:hypothetical protein